MANGVIKDNDDDLTSFLEGTGNDELMGGLSTQEIIGDTPSADATVKQLMLVVIVQGKQTTPWAISFGMPSK